MFVIAVWINFRRLNKERRRMDLCSKTCCYESCCCCINSIDRRVVVTIEINSLWNFKQLNRFCWSKLFTIEVVVCRVVVEFLL